jgi:hypothetical protein
MTIVVAFFLCVAPPVYASAATDSSRVFEMVSPAQKNGSVAGATNKGKPLYAVASAGGGPGAATASVLFGGVGPIESETTGIDAYSVARRSIAGWSVSPAIGRGIGQVDLFDGALTIEPSSDLSRVLFTAVRSFVPSNPVGNPRVGAYSTSIYLASTNGSPEWIGQPRAGYTPDPLLGMVTSNPLAAGAATDLSRVYFSYYGTLVPEDASREAVIAEQGGANHFKSDKGFYEWSASNGLGLINAGELPDGSFHPYGAIPAGGIENVPENFDNDVSATGSDAFFVSPAPAVTGVCNASGYTGAGGCTPELYVHETAADGSSHTDLVTRSELPGHEGQPAPHGPVATRQPNQFLGNSTSYAYASSDGSKVFFTSTDQLTRDAPSDESLKEYAFKTTSGMVTYLPGVAPPLLAASENGSQFVFENTTTAPAELELWSNGQPLRIAKLPTPEVSPSNGGGELRVDPVRMLPDGSVVFQTDAPVAGEFENGGGFEQVYRYDSRTHTLLCISCEPRMAPQGDASLSNDDLLGSPASVDDRGISTGGGIFFDTPSALVPQDVNGTRDVYEWSTAGGVTLISAGTGERPSYFLDNSASGRDVFIATADGLAASDTDGGYDVYDARVGGGFGEPPIASECEGEACQHPPGPSPVFGVPSGSAVLPASGNMTPSLTSSKVKHAKRTKSPKRKKARRRMAARVRERSGARSAHNGRVPRIGGRS